MSFRGFLLFITLLATLLIAASVTIHQEFRWLYAPFVVCVIYLSYLASRLRLPERAKYVGLVVVALCILGLDLYYLRFAGNVFFVSGQHYADSLYDGTVGRYGSEMRDYSVYIAEEQPEDRWFLAETLFLAPYLGWDNQRIAYIADAQDVAALPQLDRDHTLIFKRDPATRSFVDVTEDVLGDE